MPANISIKVFTLLATAFTMTCVQSEKPNPIPAFRERPSNIGKTFRVRGVPRSWDEDDLQSFLEDKAYSKLEIGSLANEVHGRTQTATLTFQKDSSQLQEILALKKLKIPLQLLPKKPTRSSNLEFDRDFDGITTLYAPSSQDHRVDLIAICGLGGHAFGSFKERNGEHMWLRDALPYDITGEDGDTLDIPIARVMLHGYESTLQGSDSFQNLEDIGTSFHSSLRSMAIAGSFRPIILVAHSLGGLIVKETLISLSKSDDAVDQKLLQAVYGITFFGVPHDGMDIQSLISIVGNGPNRFLIESIGSHGSQILSIYQREFPQTLGGRGESKVICFYETLKSPTARKDENGKWKMAGPVAVLVSKSSATHCRPWENGQQYICAINRTHSEMVKFSSEDSEYEKVLERIQSLVREARKAQEARQAREAQKHEFQPTLSKEALNCLKSLAFDGMTSRALEIEPAVSGTCEWLIQHEAFRNWAEFNQELLWIKGKPGSGKSTLLNYVFINQKHSPNARDSDLVLSFFFHGRGGDLQRTPLGFFRSLLHQILKQMPDCLSGLVITFQNKCKEIGEYNLMWQWHPKELWFALESCLLKILESRPIWLFVDALDECGEDSAKDLVQKFELLFKRSTALPAYTNQVHICFSCRHYPILSSPGLAEICLERENQADIHTYVKSEMSSFKESIPTTVLYSIIERASGVFLWAQLVVKRIQTLGLEGAGPNEIKAAVGSIPQDLELLYYELIRGMRPAAIKLIQWIYFATRPLSVTELRWAMAIDASCSSLQACQNTMGYVPTDERMEQRIVTLSQGLAEVASGSDTPIVQFIHQSVKDFIIDKGLLALHGDSVSINEAFGMSHLDLFKTCIRYLTMNEIESVAGSRDNGDQIVTDFPFLSYATTSWVSHMKQSDDHDVPAEQFLELLSWPSNDVINIWAVVYHKIRGFSSDCPSDYTRLIHVLARYDIQGVMNAILQRLGQGTMEVDSQDGHGQTPLACAAKGGHEAVVKLLLATGQANIDSKDFFDMTPLACAAEGGHEAVVKLLLATGQADINSKDDSDKTPLACAAKGGHEAVVKLLLATGQANIDSKDFFDMTPLACAAEGGHEAVVKLLLATYQVDINSKDKYSQTPLTWAAEKGHEAVVKLLLATGQVKINSKDKYCRTPLLWAARKGHEAVVKLLLATGQVEINVKDDKYGYTPLSWAAQNGNEVMVKLLLATGQADIDSKDNNGRTPLAWAAQYHYEAIENLLQDYARSHP